jgi:hypothetical protein
MARTIFGSLVVIIPITLVIAAGLAQEEGPGPEKAKTDDHLVVLKDAQKLKRYKPKIPRISLGRPDPARDSEVKAKDTAGKAPTMEPSPKAGKSEKAPSDKTKPRSGTAGELKGN